MILGLCSHKISVNIKLDTISRINNPITSVYIMLNICLFRKPLSPEMREAMKKDLIVLSSADMSTEAANRMHTARCSAPQLGADILIKDPGSNTWGLDQPFDKHHIIQRLVGYRPTMGRKNGNDEICMEKFLGVASISSLQCPQFAPQSEFLPEGAALIDYLSVSQERMDNYC